HHGPGATYSPISVVHATIQPGAEVDIPWRPDFNALLYVLNGSGYVAGERRPIRTGQLAVLGSGHAIRVGANRQQDSHTPALDVYIMGGLPIGEPVAWYGPFVMNTHEELARAFEDYRAGCSSHLYGCPGGSADCRASSKAHHRAGRSADDRASRCPDNGAHCRGHGRAEATGRPGSARTGPTQQAAYPDVGGNPGQVRR